MLRSATAPLDGVIHFVFKGGTSPSKAHGIIERFSEDVDLLVVSERTGKPLKRLLRGVADRTSDALHLDHDREAEGQGFLNARYEYPARRQLLFLTSGVLLEMGSRGGPSPNEQLPVRSLMAGVAEKVDQALAREFADLSPFDTTVLAPERTLAEKLAFLHHRSSINDADSLRRGARHLYDVALLLRSDRVKDALRRGEIVDLMIDIDARSDAAKWSYTPRPEGGFAASPAFGSDPVMTDALRGGYDTLTSLVWGTLPTFDEAIDVVRSSRVLI